MSRDRFFAMLKEEFNPGLRAAGFKGSGQHFRRSNSEVVHVISLQGNKWGGSCAVNLGVHPLLLPDTIGRPLDPRKAKEYNCEFRCRLSGGNHEHQWWNYGNESVTPEQSARSLIAAYFREGESFFQSFSSVASILATLEARITSGKDPTRLTETSTEVRCALAAARIHRQQGNIATSRWCAQFALANLGQGVGLKDELDRLANQAMP